MDDRQTLEDEVVLLREVATRAEMHRALAQLLMIGELRPDMPIAEALEMVPLAREIAG